MKTPGADHPIGLAPCRRRVRAVFHRHVIADTDDALVLREAGHPPVYYLPMDDVEMSFLARTDHTTSCPYKGQASYWSIYMDGRLAEDTALAYEDPHPAAAALRGRVAFDPKAVEVYEMDEAQTQRGAAPRSDSLLP